MNFFDLIIIIPVLWGFWRGFTRGIIMEAATLIAFVLGIWGGIHLSDIVTVFLRNAMNTQSPYIPLISFALVFVGILMLVYGVAKLVERLAEAVALGLPNKLLGGLFSATKYLLALSALFFVLDVVEKQVTLVSPATKDSSLLYRPVSKIAPLFIPGLRDSELGKQLQQSEG